LIAINQGKDRFFRIRRPILLHGIESKALALRGLWGKDWPAAAVMEMAERGLRVGDGAALVQHRER
jgi:hypothetical protein